MVSGIFILYRPDQESAPFELLLLRGFHNDLPDHRLVVADFDHVYKRTSQHQRTPFYLSGGISYIYLEGANNVGLLAVTRRNANAMLTVVFLRYFYSVLRQYLGQKGNTLDRDVISDNFVLIYELLDECVDFGVVQLSDFNILKEFIKTEANLCDNELSDSDTEDQRKLQEIRSTHNQAIKTDAIDTDAYINSLVLRLSSLAISWRPKGIFYAKNEIYIDIIETCEFYYDLDVDVIKTNEIHGRCQVRSYLSGMPDCKLSFNEQRISKIGYEEKNDAVDSDSDDEPDQPSLHPQPPKSIIPIRNVQFHQCIQLDLLYQDNIVKFTPPDDEFTLMTYYVDQQKQKKKLPLIMIEPTYRIFRDSKRVQVLCVLTPKFKKRLHCKKLVVRLPINPHLFKVHSDDLKYKAQAGDVSFKIDTSELLWTLDVTGATKDLKMMAEMTLLDTSALTPELVVKALIDPKLTVTPEPEDSAARELDLFYGVDKTKVAAAVSVTDLQNYSHVSVSFHIPLAAYSGLKLTYLSVTEDQLKYTCFPWVRYLTRTNEDGSYRFRLGAKNFQFV